MTPDAECAVCGERIAAGRRFEVLPSGRFRIVTESARDQVCKFCMVLGMMKLDERDVQHRSKT